MRTGVAGVRAAAAVASMMLVLVVVAAACQRGDERRIAEEWALERHYEHGPTTVALLVSRTQLTVADTVSVRLEVVAPEAYVVILPEAEAFAGSELQVREVLADPPRLTESDSQLVRRASTFVLRPFLPGDYHVPALRVAWSDAVAGGESAELETDLIPLQVASLLDPTSEPTLREPPPPPRAPVRWGRIVVVALAAAGLVILGVLGYRRSRRSRPTPQDPQRSPTALALAALRELEESDLLPGGEIKNFHTRVSAIVRQYVEVSFGVRALEQTTDEFLTAWRDADNLGAEHQAALRGFLEQCDLVKFARAEPTQTVSFALLATARRFVEAQDGPA